MTCVSHDPRTFGAWTQDSAMLLPLESRDVQFWWDTKCLVPGIPWEEGFANGLNRVTVFVLVLSKLVLAAFSSPTPDISCDNVPLEHQLVCVFITAGPSTKLLAWGGGIWEDMCYERRRAEACVDEAAQLVMEPKKRGDLRRICPILVGELEPHDQLGELYGDFFFGNSMPNSPKVVVKAVLSVLVRRLLSLARWEPSTCRHEHY
jgi:hypothetical protein